MSETAADKVNRILRDHEGYTGDGKGGDGALPVGDRSTAVKPIVKRDLREALIAPLQDTWDARDKAQEWAEGTGEPGDPGSKSAKSWSEVSEDWAESPTEPGGPGSASAKTWSDKANQWAENPEDAPVEPGEFSALHWATKAEQWAGSVGNPVSYNPNQGLTPTQQQDARDNLGLGTAATVDHGTDPGEVPLNSDLGDLATMNVADLPVTSYYEVITASGTWIKPPGFGPDARVIVEAWGGGAGGGSARRGSSNTNYSGARGGGGAYHRREFRFVDLPGSVPYAIGAGGAAGAAPPAGGGVTAGAAGGDTTFGTYLTALGGQSNQNGSSTVPGWGGGSGGFGGGQGAGGIVGQGGVAATSSTNGGGSGGDSTPTGSGTSAWAVGLPGEVPGGGGGAATALSDSPNNIDRLGGDGARGEVRIWIVG